MYIWDDRQSTFLSKYIAICMLYCKPLCRQTSSPNLQTCAEALRASPSFAPHFVGHAGGPSVSESHLKTALAGVGLGFFFRMYGVFSPPLSFLAPPRKARASSPWQNRPTVRRAEERGPQANGQETPQQKKGGQNRPGVQEGRRRNGAGPNPYRASSGSRGSKKTLQRQFGLGAVL